MLKPATCASHACQLGSKSSMFTPNLASPAVFAIVPGPAHVHCLGRARMNGRLGFQHLGRARTTKCRLGFQHLGRALSDARMVRKTPMFDRKDCKTQQNRASCNLGSLACASPFKLCFSPRRWAQSASECVIFWSQSSKGKCSKNDRIRPALCTTFRE